MARIDTPADPLADLAFEVERFEWTSDDRLLVTGRWFGVRGRRFMRPTLHLRVDGRRRRLIAVLDHKPWAADTEETVDRRLRLARGARHRHHPAARGLPGSRARPPAARRRRRRSHPHPAPPPQTTAPQTPGTPPRPARARTAA